MPGSGKAARNEKTKLTATSLNTVGLAFVVTGAVVPIIDLVFSDSPTPSPIRLAMSVWWVALALGLHVVARGILKAGRMTTLEVYGFIVPTVIAAICIVGGLWITRRT